MLRWGAAFDARDRDGRTPLHWAAYKGFHDCVRLLLVLGCSPHDVDVEGCNALHWAALRGNSEAATITLQARPAPPHATHACGGGRALNEHPAVAVCCTTAPLTHRAATQLAASCVEAPLACRAAA